MDIYSTQSGEENTAIFSVSLCRHKNITDRNPFCVCAICSSIKVVIILQRGNYFIFSNLILFN